MESLDEVYIISDSGSKNVCTMFEFVNGGTLESFEEKNCHSGRHGVDFIGDDYLISAFKDRPRVKIWQFGQSDSESRRITTPGIVSALAVSKCGHYCIAGIGKAIYIWEIATGNLESHMEYHVQDITCVRFSSDGSHFITGGKDGMVFVFFLTDVVTTQDSVIDVPKARYVWTDHAAEITDIHVGYVGYYSRVASVSKDRTCRIYELDTGNHLCTIHVDVPLTAVTMDICEYFLFLGTVEGNIHRINLFDTNEAEIHFEDIDTDNVFSGHKGEITSLCVSHSGKYLVSGSTDLECRVWDITNFTVFRKFATSGPVTNVLCSLVPPGVKNKKYVPRLLTANFKKAMSHHDYEEFIPTNIDNQTLSLFHAGTPDQFFDSRVLNCSTEALEKKMAQGTLTLDDLSRINNEMYSFALNDVFVKSDSSEGGD